MHYLSIQSSKLTFLMEQAARTNRELFFSLKHRYGDQFVQFVSMHFSKAENIAISLFVELVEVSS